MGGIPHRGQRQTPIVAQTTYDDLSRMQPHAHHQLLRRKSLLMARCVQSLLQRERRQHSALGMILMRHRRAKQDQDALIQHTLQRPAIALHLLQDQREEPLPPLVQRLSLRVLR